MAAPTAAAVTPTPKIALRMVISFSTRRRRRGRRGPRRCRGAGPSAVAHRPPPPGRWPRRTPAPARRRTPGRVAAGRASARSGGPRWRGRTAWSLSSELVGVDVGGGQLALPEPLVGLLRVLLGLTVGGHPAGTRREHGRHKLVV